MKNLTDYKRLNHILHHPSQQDVRFGQDMQAKHEDTQRNPQAPIKRYVAIELIKLMKRRQRITIHIDKNHNVTAKECDTNTLALIKSLKSIKFITMSHRHTSNSTTQATIKLSPIGKDYIYKYIPRYKQIYRYLKSGSITMKNSRNSSSLRLLDLLSIILCSLLGPIIIVIGASACYLIHSMTFLVWMVYITIFCALGIPSFLGVFSVPQKIIRKIALPHIHENISQDIQKATRINFGELLPTKVGSL